MKGRHKRKLDEEIEGKRKGGEKLNLPKEKGDTRQLRLEISIYSPPILTR